VSSSFSNVVERYLVARNSPSHNDCLPTKFSARWPKSERHEPYLAIWDSRSDIESNLPWNPSGTGTRFTLQERQDWQFPFGTGINDAATVNGLRRSATRDGWNAIFWSIPMITMPTVSKCGETRFGGPSKNSFFAKHWLISWRHDDLHTGPHRLRRASPYNVYGNVWSMASR